MINCKMIYLHVKVIILGVGTAVADLRFPTCVKQNTFCTLKNPRNRMPPSTTFKKLNLNGAGGG